MTRDEYIADAAARLIAARIITYSGAVDEACCLAGRLEECGVAPWQDDETVGIEAVELCRQAVKAECAAKEAALRDLADLRAKLAAAEKERDAAINRADSYACERCGIRTGIDAVVPHDVWNKLSPNSDETGLLCLWCMDSIAAERGIVAEVELHWGGGRALKQADAAPSTVTVDCLRQTIQHLAAKLKDAERKRDQWEAEYDARRAAEKAKNEQRGGGDVRCDVRVEETDGQTPRLHDAAAPPSFKVGDPVEYVGPNTDWVVRRGVITATGAPMVRVRFDGDEQAYFVFRNNLRLLPSTPEAVR